MQDQMRSCAASADAGTMQKSSKMILSAYYAILYRRCDACAMQRIYKVRYAYRRTYSPPLMFREICPRIATDAQAIVADMNTAEESYDVAPIFSSQNIVLW